MGMEIEQLAEKHEKVYTAFLAMDTREHPLPPAPHWWDGLPWMMLPFGIIAIAAVLLSSLRTAPVFQQIALPLIGSWSYAEAVLAVLAIELAMVFIRYWGVLESARKGRPHNIDAWASTGFWVAFVVAVLANLYGSTKDLALLTSIRDALDLTISVIVGLSAPLLAFISGDILGALWTQSQQYRDGLLSAYRQAMDEYQDSRERRWRARREDYGMVIRVEKEPVRALSSLSNGQSGHGAQERRKWQEEKGLAYLVEHPESASLSVREFAALVGISKSKAAEVIKLHREEQS